MVGINMCWDVTDINMCCDVTDINMYRVVIW